MALQVWLPLTDNTRNYGLSNGVAVTNNGATLDNNGRIGKCYSFNGTNNKLTCTLSSTISKSIGSIALWVKFNSFPGSSSFYEMIHIGSNGGYANCLFGFYMEYTNRINISINGSSTNTNSYTHSLSANTWYHLCATFDGTIVKLYINGAQVLSKEATKASYATAASNVYIGGTTSYWLNGKINDVRVYDNCLSPEDVKRLYQTKIWDIMPYTHMGREFLFDRSGYGLMPLVNTGTTWHGNALYFDGSSRMRPKAGNVGFNLTGGTMSVWFTPKIIPSDYRIIYVDSTSKFGIGFYSSTSMILCSGDQARTSVVTSSFTAGKLYNMIVSYDSGYTAIKAYLNGTALTPSSNNNWVESNGLTLGGRTLNSTSWFNGKIHKIDIFKEQLSANDCLALYNKEKTHFLPDDYVRLEYLEGTGTQWIDTEYLINANNLPKLRYTLDAEATNTALGNRWWVCGVGGGSLTFHVGIGNGNASTFPFTYGRGVSDAATSAYGSIGVRYRWELDMEKQTYKVWSSSREKLADVTFTRQTPTASLQQTLPLFRWIRYQGNTSSPNGYIFGMKIYGMEMYEESILKRNMVPAKRKSDGVLGMYDTVTKKFFTNAGTGTFTAGPEW